MQDLPTGVNEGRIIVLGRSPRSVAEVVALLGLSLTLVTIIVTDALCRGLLRVHIAQVLLGGGRSLMDVLVWLREDLRRMI